MWHCSFKFPYDYYAIENKKGETLSSAKTKGELKSKLKRGQKIIKKHYEGCPAHNTKPKDDFEF